MVHRCRCHFLVNINQQLTIYHVAENFGTAYVSVIRDFDIIPTVAKDGRVAFVGVDDIAKAAYDALVTEKNLKTDHYVLGPQLHSYDEVSCSSSSLKQTMTRK
jgi:festuclavine dehydrogenase